jgi:AcrR family transcriptional regulator
MSIQHGEVGRLRREQIVDAAVAVIAAQGLQNLSLSAIEQKAGMSRGQLTYYFPAKEDILLAVFDRMLAMMHRQVQGNEDAPTPCVAGGTPWERLRGFLTFLILTPPSVPEFHALQYTFLSQIGHRADFRQRLASLYEQWRGHMAGDVADDLARSPQAPPVSPRTLASFVQALLHGLAVQCAADPDAYDRHEMLDLCLAVLAALLGQPEPDRQTSESAPANGARRRSGRPGKETSPANPK